MFAGGWTWRLTRRRRVAAEMSTAALPIELGPSSAAAFCLVSMAPYRQLHVVALPDEDILRVVDEFAVEIPREALFTAQDRLDDVETLPMNSLLGRPRCKPYA